MTVDRSELLAQVASIAPEVAGGYEAIREAIETDGAISAAHKALLVACGAVARGQAALAAEELRRGRALGLTDAEAGAAGAAFLLIRGEDACRRFIEAAGPLVPAADPRPACTTTAAEYFTRYMGVDALPARMAIMAERAPALFSGYHRMHHGTLVADPAAAQLGELVMITVNAAELATRFVAIHATTARRAGVSDEQLIEAVVCAFPAAGIAAWAAAAEAIFPDA